jgi:hypothetical protein
LCGGVGGGKKLNTEEKDLRRKKFPKNRKLKKEKLKKKKGRSCEKEK